jgi:hypothetical protein
VRNTKHTKEKLHDLVLELLAVHAREKLAGSLEREGKGESLSDGEGGGVDVVLCGENA